MKLSLRGRVSDLGSFPICATLHRLCSFPALPRNRESPSVGSLRHRRDLFHSHSSASMAFSSEPVYLLLCSSFYLEFPTVLCSLFHEKYQLLQPSNLLSPAQPDLKLIYVSTAGSVIYAPEMVSCGGYSQTHPGSNSFTDFQSQTTGGLVSSTSHVFGPVNIKCSSHLGTVPTETPPPPDPPDSSIINQPPKANKITSSSATLFHNPIRQKLTPTSPVTLTIMVKFTQTSSRQGRERSSPTSSFQERIFFPQVLFV
ncbi:hypothetical protein HID58_018689, partial [Brassica napus]